MTIPFRGTLLDGRPIAMEIPMSDYDNFVKEIVGHADRQFCPEGIDFFEVLLHDGRRARLFVKPENKENYLNAITEQTVKARGGVSGDTKTVVLPCKGCGEPKGDKSLGIVSFVTAKLSGPASTTARAVRDAICTTCHDKDSKGERLFRIIDGMPFCGCPRSLLAPSTLYRDEKADGCGCALHGEDGKHAYKDSECPKGYWGPER